MRPKITLRMTPPSKPKMNEALSQPLVLGLYGWLGAYGLP
jgi:hypothetical protein